MDMGSPHDEIAKSPTEFRDNAMTNDASNLISDFQSDSEFGSRVWFDKLFGASPVGISITRVRDHAIDPERASDRSIDRE